MKQVNQPPVTGFFDLGLSNDITQILNQIRFKTPTPIQEKSIPQALLGKDILGIAQTGTGKTLAFFLPILQRIDTRKDKAVILVPTRELAHQVEKNIEQIGKRLQIRTALLIGGANIQKQIKILKRNPHIIVATPGRLIDHIDRKTIKLTNVNFLVLDEADRMLDMGFAPQIKRILKVLPKKRQTFLFSATMPDEIARITREYMKDPIRIQIASEGSSAKNITQGVYFVNAHDKRKLLESVLQDYKGKPVLIFCRTKHGTKKLASVLKKDGYTTEELHSNLSPTRRQKSLNNFKNGKSSIMVATDIAARGIDVKEIALVINYDLPEQKEDYVHRIGRTGRAGHKGNAISFATPSQRKHFKLIERYTKKNILVLELPSGIKSVASHSQTQRNKKPYAHNKRRRSKFKRKRN